MQGLGGTILCRFVIHQPDIDLTEVSIAHPGCTPGSREIRYAVQGITVPVPPETGRGYGITALK